MRRFLGMFAIVVLALTLATPGRAQESTAPLPPLPEGLTYPEFQGLGCLIGGTVVSVSAATYAELVSVGTATPLVLPVMAAGFVAGCGVGSIMSPGLWWIYRRF